MCIHVSKMQFTSGQLSGGCRYGSTTRVGNWQEDVHLENAKRDEFGKAQAAGKLVSSMLCAKDAKYNKPVELSSGDWLSYGMIVMVTHSATGSSLAVDLTEKVIENDEESRLVTASPPPRGNDDGNKTPVARTAFEIVSLSGEEGPLKFGHPFSLRCHESLGGYYLSSELKTCFNASRIANQQPVAMSSATAGEAKRDASTAPMVWTCEKIAPTHTGIIRHLSTDDPVPANQPVVIQHRSTKQALAADPKYTDINDFGSELEVTCHNHFGNGKLDALSAEMRGTTTPATTARLEKSPNFWQFRTSTTL